MADGRRILFFGTPDPAERVLRELFKRCDVGAVITQPDKPAGRHRHLKPPPVKVLTEEHNAAGHQVALYQPASLKGEELEELLQNLEAHGPFDLAVICAYGKIIPRRLFDLPRHSSVNIHFSLLPRWRGASPVQAALRAGDRQSGISVQFINEQLDEGDLLFSQPVDVPGHYKAQQLFDQLLDLLPETVNGIIDRLENGRLDAAPQDHARATYCRKIKPEDAALDPAGSAAELVNTVRAFSIWPGSRLGLDGKTVKIYNALLPSSAPAIDIAARTRGIKPVKGAPADLAAGLYSLLHDHPDNNEKHQQFINDFNITPGSVCGLLADALVVAVKDSFVLIDEMQPAGKKHMDGRSFLNGHPFTWGDGFTTPPPA